MAFQEPRRQTEDLLAIVEETQFRASQELTPRALTGTNWLTTTTITNASVVAAHIGAYAIPEDGSARGQVRQITSISGTVATIDTAWNSTANVTSIRIWRPAEVPIRATGSGSTTTIVASDHASITNEPDDYWNASNHHVWFVGGQNAGAAVDETDFATATGTFTFTDAVTSTVANELALLRSTLRPEGNYTVAVTQNSLDRIVSGYSDADVNVPTTAAGSASFELPCRGLSASAGNATQAVRPREMGSLIRAIFTEDRDTGSTVSSASGTTLNVASGSNFSVGGLILLSTGEVAQIRSISSNALTLGTSHMTAGNVEVSSTVYASAWYQRKQSGFRTFTVDHYMGGLVRKVLHGCGPSLTMSVDRDQVIRFAWNMTAGEAFQYTRTRPVVKGATLPIDILDTTVPSDAKACRVLFNAIEGVLLHNFTLDFGFRPVLRPSITGPNATDGHTMTLAPISGTARIMADEDDRTSFEDLKDLVYRRATIDFLLQKGTAPTETFGLCIPAMQIVDAPSSHDNGQGMIEFTFKAVHPQSVPGNSYSSSLPSAVIGWM